MEISEIYPELFDSIYDEMVQNLVGVFNQFIEEGKTPPNWNSKDTTEFIEANREKIRSLVTEMMTDYLREDDEDDYHDCNEHQGRPCYKITGEPKGLDELQHREGDWVREYLFNEDFGIKLPTYDEMVKQLQVSHKTNDPVPLSKSSLLPKSLLEDYARLAMSWGWIPIPLKGWKNGASPGGWKRPFLPKWDQTNQENAMRHIEREKALENIGVLTGAPSGIFVVDIDVKSGGLELWRELIREHGEPFTFTVKTGSGGYHYYFKYTEKVAHLRNITKAVKGRGIDIRTNGGQIIMPGSKNYDTGELYKVKIPLEGKSPYDPNTNIIALSEIPEWLLLLLNSTQEELDRKYPRKYL